MGRDYTAQSPEHVARLKERETARKKFDPGYVTADEAAQIPPEMRHDPLVVSRVRASEPYWPERVAAASQVFNPDNLPGGAGEVITDRSVPAESLFADGPARDD